MKKMIFSAIAMVAFTGSAFASNEIVNYYDSENNLEVISQISEEDYFTYCTITITVRDGNGAVTDSRNYYRIVNESGATGALACAIEGAKIAKEVSDKISDTGQLPIMIQ